MKFTRALPALLKRTNIVLEIRDSRLPLTSINRTLEGELKVPLSIQMEMLYTHFAFTQYTEWVLSIKKPPIQRGAEQLLDPE